MKYHQFTVGTTVRKRNLQGVIEKISEYTPWLWVKFNQAKKPIILHYSEVELVK